MGLNDAVSKAEVLETYAELYDVFDDYKGIQKELHKIYDKLNALPTADVVEREKGKWETEIRTIRGHKIPFPVCSVCGKYSTDEYTYCPNCGAMMGERRKE